MNVVVVRGVLSSPAEQRTLPSGDRLVVLQVTVPRDDGPDESVPVAWFGAPARAAALDAGARVLVTGRVRRRWFRAGGRTVSTTEVVAERVVPAGGKRAVSLLAEVGSRLG